MDLTAGVGLAPAPAVKSISMPRKALQICLFLHFSPICVYGLDRKKIASVYSFQERSWEISQKMEKP